MGKIMKFAILLIVGLITACASTPAGTFSQSLLAAETADDAVVTTTTSLLNAGQITSVQAQKIMTITDGVNSALTLANNTYQSGNVTSAQTQITTAVNLLAQLQACLNTAAARQPIDNCLAPIVSK
jgi:hypothetical protein